MNVEDLGSPDAVCEMCETQDIRYVHYMSHPDHQEILGVGCVCAEHMEEDYEAPRRRERLIRNSARRKQRWLSRKWYTLSNDHSYINTDGFNVTIFRKRDGTWGGMLTDRNTGQSISSRQVYATEDQAKLAAFDGMVFLKNERGWGS
ncbi:hypothetical protein [Pacificispira sp.]|uniref:hypothetical protein n=1 Tax=Pacificispira sp. TaxID=2888761 RepID=UPI003B51BDF3